jgi:hypothetical protein
MRYICSQKKKKIHGSRAGVFVCRGFRIRDPKFRQSSNECVLDHAVLLIDMWKNSFKPCITRPEKRVRYCSLPLAISQQTSVRNSSSNIIGPALLSNFLFTVSKKYMRNKNNPDDVGLCKFHIPPFFFRVPLNIWKGKGKLIRLREPAWRIICRRGIKTLHVLFDMLIAHNSKNCQHNQVFGVY